MLSVQRALWVWVAALASTRGSEAPDAEQSSPSSQARLEAGRRLEALIDERLTFHRHDVDELDAEGLLPMLEVGGMRLTETLTVLHNEPYKVRRTTVPLEYKAQRRLNDLDTVMRTPMDFDIPRDRVRMMALLNAGVRYNSTYNWSLVYPAVSEVFEKGQPGYWSPQSLNMSDPKDRMIMMALNNATNTSKGRNVTPLPTEMVEDLMEREMKLLADRGNTLRSAWSSATRRFTDWFEGSRQPPGDEGLGTNDRQRPQDLGVSISVYRDPATVVLVFHGGYTAVDWWYIYELHKIWLIAKFEDEVRTKWVLDGRQDLKPEMLTRKAATDKERHVRCAFKDLHQFFDLDLENLAKSADVAAKELYQTGLWVIVKKLIRAILPAGREKLTKETYYFTGSGTGGMHAALGSMWLAKNDDKKYDTYVMSGVGWECAARSLMTNDMTPWADQPQLYVYAHVGDFIATAVDRSVGKVCLYGTKNFSTSQAVPFCSKFIGHTGPEIWYRGGSFQGRVGTSILMEDFPTKTMLLGQRMFDACHYYTHSPWYAAMLFTSESVLMLDGSTDGGCSTRSPLAQVDRLKKCPLGDVLDDLAKECKLLNIVKSKLPLGALFSGAMTMIGILCFCGLSGLTCLTRVTDDSHLFKEDTGKRPFPFCWLPVAKEHQRAREARLRARQKQAREFQKKYGIMDPEAEEQEMQKKKKKKQQKPKKQAAGEKSPLVPDEGEVTNMPTDGEQARQNRQRLAEAMASGDEERIREALDGGAGSSEDKKVEKDDKAQEEKDKSKDKGKDKGKDKDKKDTKKGKVSEPSRAGQVDPDSITLSIDKDAEGSDQMGVKTSRKLGNKKTTEKTDKGAKNSRKV